MMLWFYGALLCAFFSATGDLLSKMAMRDSNPYVIAWMRIAFAIPFLFFMLFYTTIPMLDRTFWFAFAIALPLEVVAYILYVKAIHESALSLTLPFLSFTPVFLIGTSFFILGEMPTVKGIIGIFIISVGAYLLNLEHAKKGVLGPLKAIFHEKGSRKMLAAAFIYSLTSILGKVCVLHADPVFFGILYFGALAIILLPITIFMSKKTVAEFFCFKRQFVWIGLCYGIMIFFHLSSIRLVEASLMIAVKRTSLLLGIFYGWLFFHEKNLKQHVLGALFMLLGIYFMTCL